MKETDLNRIIVKSIKQNDGWAHKISDDAQNFIGTSKKPFDYFGVLNNKPIYGESKLIKNGIYAFNFKRIEDHQLTSLMNIRKRLESTCYTVFSIGFWKSRKFFYVVFFDLDLICWLMDNGIVSIKQKDIQRLIDEDKYCTIKSGEIIDLNDIENKIIGIEQWR